MIEQAARTLSSSKADAAITLHEIERELKALTEKVAALRFASLTRDTGPTDLLTLLSQQSNQFLTASDLSRLLRVDKRTVYGLKGQGLPAHRIGKELRFDPLQVAAWLKQRHQG